MQFVKEKSSFRDPGGFLFWKDDSIYRYIDYSYKKHYDFFIDSGLYDDLVKKKLIISHKEINSFSLDNSYKIIKPTKIPFISYPYEWSFSQLKDTALLTLKIQTLALKFGMTLKDCSAYNVQFLDGKPVFIDTLSFEIYKEGELWLAYKQFCQHFLAPLLLMSKVDIRLNLLLRDFIDGIPLDLTSKLLPKKTYMNFSILMNIHLHAKSQKHYEDKKVNLKKYNKKFSKRSFIILLDNLKTCIKKLKWKSGNTEWADYYSGDSYTSLGFENKKELVSKFLDYISPKVVWDLGANDGCFSRLASKKGAFVLSSDIDVSCIENNYLNVKKNNEKNIFPIFLDLTNPSPDIGWNNNERLSLKKRGKPDVILALALIHHLCISNNLPFSYVAQYFSSISDSLIIEFVPKEDKKVQTLLFTRKDIFVDYNQSCFEEEFNKYFDIKEKYLIKDSKRTLYFMFKKTLKREI
ncbi:SAM-dependent methyltransferase [Candidatus Dependentiae bacterium]|nr:SAM-dependent methyltransferase [Candidatus Dependentiae bacterium]